MNSIDFRIYLFSFTVIAVSPIVVKSDWPKFPYTEFNPGTVGSSSLSRSSTVICTFEAFELTLLGYTYKLFTNLNIGDSGGENDWISLTT